MFLPALLKPVNIKNREGVISKMLMYVLFFFMKGRSI